MCNHNHSAIAIQQVCPFLCIFPEPKLFPAYILLLQRNKRSITADTHKGNEAMENAVQREML